MTNLPDSIVLEIVGKIKRLDISGLDNNGKIVEVVFNILDDGYLNGSGVLSPGASHYVFFSGADYPHAGRVL